MKKFTLLTISMLIAFAGISLQKPKEMPKLDISAIVQHDFPATQYVRKAVPKTQIVLHHTVSGEGVRGDIGHWMRNTPRIATSFIIDREGTIHQLFSSKYWGYHLGLKVKHFKTFGLNYKNLNSSSIGIELDSWGGLKQIDGKWYASPNDFGRGNATYSKSGVKIKIKLSDDQVVVYKDGYRGYKGFEKYTDAQIDSAMILTRYLGNRYRIPLNFNCNMFDVNKDALNDTPGVWTHTSFRPDKSDCHPQDELLKGLLNLV